jgi:hypothetical protein
VDWIVSLALTPLGKLAGAAMAGVAGARLTLIIGGLLVAGAGLVLLVPGATGPGYPQPVSAGTGGEAMINE